MINPHLFPVKTLNMKHLIFALLTCSLLGAGCADNRKYDINEKSQYEKESASLEAAEKKNPARFISVKGTNKKNLLGQTVVKGTLFNKARLAHFKDIEVKLSFYSKTGALLEEDLSTVYESINPGGSVSFKSKYFAPKGTDSVAMTVTNAKF